MERELNWFEVSVLGLPIPAEVSGAASRQELLASRSPRQPRRSPAGSRLAPGLAGRGGVGRIQAGETSALLAWGGESQVPALVLTLLSLPVGKLLVFLFLCCR